MVGDSDGDNNNNAADDGNDGDKNMLTFKIILISVTHLTMKAQKTMESWLIKKKKK